MNILVSRLLKLCPIGLLFMIGCTQSHPASNYPEPFYGELLLGDSLVAAEPQQKSEREFKDLATVVKHSFTVPPASATDDTPTEIIMPMPARASIDTNEEYLFLMDMQSLIINKYGLLDGKLLDVFKYANENREVSALPSILHAENDELWIKGVVEDQIVRLNSAGEFVGYIQNPYLGGIYSVAPGRFIHVNLAEPELFHLYNGEKKEHSFGILASERERLGTKYKYLNGHGLGFTGDARTDGTGTFMYAGQYGGGLLGYKIDGSLRYFKESMDHNAFPPTPYSDGSREGHVDLDSVRAQQYPINVWNGIYYQNVLLRDVGNFVIDAYAYDTGEYLYSIPVKSEECGYIFITDDHIYANCKQGFVQLERPAPVNDRLVSENVQD